MKMHLESSIFELVKNKVKDIEIRINDEKRKKIKFGDIITIINRETKEILLVEVISLEYFDNFKDCINNYDIKRLYNKDITKKEFEKILYNFYTKEEEKEYGVVAIIFKLIKNVNNL